MSITLGVLTGYVALKAFNKQKKGAEGLTFGGQIQVTHAMLGRIRFRSDLLKDENLCQMLLAQLTKITHISKVTPTLLTGSLLIEYDHEQIDQELLIGAIYKLIGFEQQVERMQKSKILEEVQQVNKSLNYAMLDKTNGYLDIRTLVPLSFIGLAGYKIVTSGTVTSPSSISLLWWAYNSMQLGGKSDNIRNNI